MKKKRTQSQICSIIEQIISEANNSKFSIFEKRAFISKRCLHHGLSFRKIFRIAGVEQIIHPIL